MPLIDGHLLLQRFTELAKQAKQIDIAVAWAGSCDAVEALAASDADIRIVVGISANVTHPSTLRRLAEFTELPDVFEKLLMYLDNKLSIAVLGQTLTTEPGQSGSYSLGQVHNLVRADIEMSDASLLAQAIRRDVVIPMIDLNFGKQEKYPKVIIERARSYDTKEIAETLNLLVPMGLKVKADEVRSRMGYEMPDEGDDVLAPAASAMPPALGSALRRALARARGGGGDSDAIDRAIDSITPEEWQRITAPILQPLMEAATADPENFMSDLGSLYVDMDAEELQDQLTQIIFAADVHGRLTKR